MKEEVKEEHLIVVLLLTIHMPRLNLELYNYQKCHGNTEMNLKIISSAVLSVLFLELVSFDLSIKKLHKLSINLNEFYQFQ